MDPRRRAKQLTLAAVVFAAAGLATNTASAHGPLPHGEHIVLDPADPDFMFVTTNVFGHYISHDGGNTFAWLCPDLFSSSTAFESYRLHGAFLLPGVGRRIMVAGFAGTFVTADDGCTWQAVAEFTGQRMGFALQDPADSSHLLLGTTTGGAENVDNAIWQSWDGGATFERTGLRGPILIKSAVIHPATGTYYATSFTNLTWLPNFHRSDDQGATWTDFSLPEGTESVIHIVGVNPAQPGTVVMREEAFDHDNILTTRDGGETFETTLVTDTLVYEIRHRSDGTMWLGRDGGAFVSTDGGASWVDGPGTPGMTCFVGDGDPLYTCSRAVEDQSAVEVSRDEGSSWEPVFRYDQVAGPLECLGAKEANTCSDTRWEIQCTEYGEFVAGVAACEVEAGSSGGSDSSGSDDGSPAATSGSGCGCQSDSNPGFLGLPLGLLVLFRRRRPLAAAALLMSCAPTSAPASSPVQPEAAPSYELRPVADGLANPRGLLDLPDGSLLVAEAGTGDPATPRTGRLLRLSDRDGDGRFESRDVIVDGQPSVNIVTKLAVNRDEVFGFADIARGGGQILASVADPKDGTVVLHIDGENARPWSTTDDNANSLAYHPGLQRWFAVQSFANTVIDPRTGNTVTSFAPLADGQDAVPAAIVYEPHSDAFLVALFSGQIGGDTAGTGVDFVPGSGMVVRLDPTTGQTRPLIEGLTAPVDLAVDDDGRVYVLEFCRSFVGPTVGVEQARASTEHGGFERFSGRLRRWSPATKRMTTLADGLDLPTHVLLTKAGRLFVSVGQGTPGRTVPGPRGPTPIEGKIVEVSY